MGLLYFRPRLSVSALVDWLEIKPDACQRHKRGEAGGPAGQPAQHSAVWGATLQLLDTCKKGCVGTEGGEGKRCPQFVRLSL